MSTDSVFARDSIVIVGLVIFLLDLGSFEVGLCLILGLMLDLSGSFFHVQKEVKKMGRILQLIDDKLNVKNMILFRVLQSNQNV